MKPDSTGLLLDWVWHVWPREMKASFSLQTLTLYRSDILCRVELYEALRDTLFQDSSVAGEASGYAMGLVMLGSGSQTALDEMLQYAHETQHEKIIRGLAIGIAFLMYGRAEQADSVIDQLLADKVSELLQSRGLQR